MSNCSQIFFLTICLILSILCGAEEHERQVNEIEVSPESSERNARYIKLSSGPSPYPNYQGYPSSYYPSNVYYPSSPRYPSTNYYPDGSSNFYPSNNYPDYPSDRYPGNYPNKLNPSYWLSKLPFPSNNPNYPGSYYPSSNYPNYPNFPSQPPYNPDYPIGTNFIGRRYPGQGNYPFYSGSSYPGNGGYGGYQGNGGLLTYSGYDGYYSTGNRPGNIGFGYQNGRVPDNFGPVARYPSGNPSIVTPSTVSKDAK